MRLSREYVGVEVERFGDARKTLYKLRENPICIVKKGTKIELLSDVKGNAKIYNNEEDEIINPTGNFYITTDTIEPYHIILDIF